MMTYLLYNNGDFPTAMYQVTRGYMDDIGNVSKPFVQLVGDDAHQKEVETKCYVSEITQL